MGEVLTTAKAVFSISQRPALRLPGSLPPLDKQQQLDRLAPKDSKPKLSIVPKAKTPKKPKFVLTVTRRDGTPWRPPKKTKSPGEIARRQRYLDRRKERWIGIVGAMFSESVSLNEHERAAAEIFVARDRATIGAAFDRGELKAQVLEQLLEEYVTG